ncbi:hypothetical protein SR1949_41220 [Sphaerospermopsis reniformis]|uniref:Uncharacterized protein n=1 Tax=Sphaerospermopsis reniformis TaxID=531300 RepID=A0A480A731_9CYAN|nr:hypothetical protein SR1949_41220 [Sphaerospermopsis reniformis]
MRFLASKTVMVDRNKEAIANTNQLIGLFHKLKLSIAQKLTGTNNQVTINNVCAVNFKLSCLPAQKVKPPNVKV